MPAALDIPPATHREQSPIRTCSKCGCYLRSGNESTWCSPCGTPEWEILDNEVWDRISRVDYKRRQIAMDAMAELMENAV